MARKIGSLNERSLHAGLKAWYALPDGETEINIDGYVIDVIKGGQLIEIQTGSFSSIKSKLLQLTKTLPVKLVYPIILHKTLIKLPQNGNSEVVVRKSPKVERPEKIFIELVSFPELILNPLFTIELAMIEAKEIRRYSGYKHWRQNGWKTVEQTLVQVLDTVCYPDAEALSKFLPETLPDTFRSVDLEKSAQIPRWLAQKAVYCLCKMSCIEMIGKDGRYNLYKRS